MKFEVIDVKKPGVTEISVSMHLERRRVFVDRLKWRLNVDNSGREFDEYDDDNAIYVVIMTDEGELAGSARLRPTTMGSMIDDHFSHMLNGRPIRDERTWELSRLFVSRAAKSDRSMSTVLMWASARFALHHGIGALASITTPAHIRWFCRYGWNPELIGGGDTPEGPVSVCLSQVTLAGVEAIERRSRIDDSTVAKLMESIRRADPVARSHKLTPLEGAHADPGFAAAAA